MITTRLIEKAIGESEDQHFGFTGQLLAIHQLVYENNQPKVEKVVLDNANGKAVVYFPIAGEKFHLAIYLKTTPDISVTWVDTVPYHRLCFRATSTTLNYEQLCTMTTLQPGNGWNKGDLMKNGKAAFKFSCIELYAVEGPGKFEEKLDALLDLLEQDSKGISALATNANGYIQATISFHNGNTMLGGPAICKENIRRMSALQLGIDFDLYADGNFYL
ncbi:DUF4279 domain-containing protein [Chitinophaga arvensicola]|uniref:DUF4279 domain-containing protein n=1 Tax=Chitinophaga arvensicola TaxID=29529 RepID=A0A1I0S6V0_9BACT|nr:DUF4279 domain-containing protein [Chitinophaga arvensicola]SEW51453.1 protein of unknown function [Chitinophaga arvensicola]